MKSRALASLCFAGALALSTLLLSPTAEALDQGRPRILSADFELDDSAVSWMDFRMRLFCAHAGRIDRIALIFTHAVDPSTLDPSDFVITTRSGARHAPSCLTTDLSGAERPEGETNRTVFLIGDLGSATFDPPVRVAVADRLMTRQNPDGQIYDFLGVETGEVAPSHIGPSIVYAEVAPEPRPLCASDMLHRIKLAWSGAVQKISDWSKIAVVMRGDARSDSESFNAAPAMIAGDRDGDNIFYLCVKEAGAPFAVRVPKGLLQGEGGRDSPAGEAIIHRPR